MNNIITFVNNKYKNPPEKLDDLWISHKNENNSW